MSDQDKILSNSYVGLEPESPEKVIRRPPSKLPKLKTEENQQSQQDQSPKKRTLHSRIPKGYQIASFQEALKYWNSMSYAKKKTGPRGEFIYQNISIFDSNQQLKIYGLGVYLYLQLIKQLLIVCFFISLLTLLPMYICYNDDGLSGYQQSFTLTLAKFSLGNINNGDRQDYFIFVICDVLTMIVLFAFYIHWRSFHAECVQESEKDHKILNPSVYAISIVGFDPSTPYLQKNLKQYFDIIYRGAYQVEVVYNFKRNFQKFMSLEAQLEKVEKQRQVLRQTDKDNQQLVQLQKQLQEIEDEVLEVAQQFQPIYAIVHFRNLKAKYKFINVCKKYALVDKFGYKLQRCICCMPSLPHQQKFMRKDDLMIKSVNLPRPQQINWNNIDISGPSRFARYVISIILIAICIFITSSLIAFCTLYVSGKASCNDFDEATTLDEAKAGDQQLLYCYCSAHLVETDSEIGSACGNLQAQILISNIVQIGASLVSAITNVILIVIVSVIAQYLLKPDSKPQEYSFIFVAVFLSNYINSTLLPLVLNGDIYGFQSLSYLRFVKFINFDTVSVFKDFDRDWFAVISPYYTNFFIFASLSPLIQLIVFTIKRKIAIWLTKRSCENQDPSHPTIQKQANDTIIMFPFDFPTDMAVLTLQLFMCFMYSGLIPLSMPIFTFGLFLTVLCKRYIIYHYTVKIPANQNLNEKFINIIPFILLFHSFMSLWAHTAQGIFQESAFLNVADFSTMGNLHPIILRALKDIIQSGTVGLVLIWIIFDWTIIVFINFLRESCRDELQLPLSLATIENQNFQNRLQQNNILGTYKLSKSPVFGHAYRAYKNLKKRAQKQGNQSASQSSMRDQTHHKLNF